MKKVVTLVLISFIVVLGLYFFLRNTDNITNFPPKNNTAVAFGDSLVQGVGATSGHDFVSRLSVKIGKPIQNLGVSGDTTADGVARIDDVTSIDAGTVFMLLGGNDYLKKVAKEVTFQNLRTIINKLQANGSVVVLLGVRGGVLSDHFATDFKTLAQEKHVVFVPDVLDGLLGHPQLMSDEIHPNDRGYEIMANKIYEIYKKYAQ